MPNEVPGKELPAIRGATSEQDLNMEKNVKVMTYDMTDFMKQCVQLYVDLCGKNMSPLKKVSTPNLSDEEERKAMENGENEEKGEC